MARTRFYECDSCNGSSSQKADPLWKQHFPIHREKDLRRSRREFMKLLSLVSGAFSFGSIGLAVRGAMVKTGLAKPKPLPALEIAGAEALEPGTSLSFTMPDEVPGLLVRMASGDLIAYDRRCTHLSCPILWNAEANRMDCPCHKGAFEIETGIPTQGPPERPLVKIALEVREGKIWATGYQKPAPEEKRHGSV